MILGVAARISTAATEVVASRCLNDRHALTASRQVFARPVDDHVQQDEGCKVGAAHEDSSAGACRRDFLMCLFLQLGRCVTARSGEILIPQNGGRGGLAAGSLSSPQMMIRDIEDCLNLACAVADVAVKAMPAIQNGFVSI